MRRIQRGIRGVVLSGLLLAMPDLASAEVLCLTDSGSSGGDIAERGAVEEKTGYVSFSGTSGYVYNSYSGCGERTRFFVSDSLALTYSMAEGQTPFDRLAGLADIDESFFDAEFTSAVGRFGEAGYAVSNHAASDADEDGSDWVTGSRVWFRSADKRLGFSSEMAVSSGAAQKGGGTAQRHQVSMVLLDRAERKVSTSLSYSSVDREFKGRRSLAQPDRETIGATTTLQEGDATLSLAFSHAHDNLKNDSDRATHAWQTVSAEGSYKLTGSWLMPDRIMMHAGRYDYRTDFLALEEPSVTELTEETGLDAAWVWRGGADDGATLTSNLSADWTVGGASDLDNVTTGANTRLSLDLERLLAVPAEFNTGAAVTSDAAPDVGLGWRWDFAAEVDGLDLLLDRRSTREAYVVGRVGSVFHRRGDELGIDYRGMLAAGVRF